MSKVPVLSSHPAPVHLDTRIRVACEQGWAPEVSHRDHFPQPAWELLWAYPNPWESPALSPLLRAGAGSYSVFEPHTFLGHE